MVRVGGGEHRRRDRCDHEGETGSEHEDRRQHARDVGVARVDRGHQEHPRGDHERSDGERDPRADALGEGAGAGREEEHQKRDRKRGRAGLDRRVPHRDLQEGDEQEEDAAERRVDHERDEVRRRELARGEHVERHHRIGASPLDGKEGDQRRDAARGRRNDRGGHPFRRLDQRVGGAGKAERGEQRAAAVERAVAVGSRVSGTWRAAIAMTKIPSGRLIRKIARHETASTR